MICCHTSRKGIFAWRCSVKIVLWNLQSSKKNTFDKTSLLIELLAQACNFIIKENQALLFPCVFCEVFKNTYLVENLQTTVVVFLNIFKTFLLFRLKLAYIIRTSFFRKIPDFPTLVSQFFGFEKSVHYK